MMVPPELVTAAVEEAEQRGQDVADIPLTALATAAGVSRSTLIRRLGGSRRALDDAVRAAGVDPGGRRPVRERAVDAAGVLISEHGLGSVTLDAVAAEAGCSLPSLHATFGNRDGLLAAVFERYSPVLDLEALLADPPDSIEETVRGIYRAAAAAFERQPRLLPAVIADALSRPDGPGRRMFSANLPRLIRVVGGWMLEQVRLGRVRPLPLPLLVQQMIGPMIFHLATRPVAAPLFGPQFPSIDQAADAFAAGFLRAVAPADPPNREDDQ